MIYYLTIILLFALSFGKEILSLRIDTKFVRVLVFFFLLALGGLRYNVGSDWESYKIFYESLQIGSLRDFFSSRLEPLFVAYCSILGNISRNYSFFIFVTFLFAFFLKYKTIVRYSPDIYFSLIIYLFTLLPIYDFNGIRQGIALGLTLFSIKYILNRNVIGFFVFVLLAILFHYSAVIFLPFYYLSRIKLNVKSSMIILLIALVSAVSLRALILNSSIIQFLLSTEALKHYLTYTNNDYYDYSLNISIISIAILQRIFIFSMFLLTYKNIKVNTDLKLLLLNGYLISIVLFLLLSFSVEFSARLSFYYKALEMIIIPLIITTSNIKIFRFILMSLFVLFSIYGLYRLIETPYNTLNPYQTILIPDVKF